VERLKSVLVDELGGEWKAEEGARHGFMYREVLRLPDDRPAATMLHGGNGDLPHVYASSDATDRFVEVIRHYWGDTDPATGNLRRDAKGRLIGPLHKVSRMDAALDYDDGPGTWERLLDICTRLAKAERVEGDERKRVAKIRTNQMGDWVHNVHGRTFYLGAFKSAVIARLYEKGIQLREDAAKYGRARPDISETLVRLEVEVRPDKEAKVRAATATPLEAFGYSEWSRELLRRVESADVPRVHIRERRDSDHERALNWMVKQYEAHLLQEVADAGGWDHLGEALRRRMETGAGNDAPAPEDDRPF
jgi:hypothetical protein